MNQATERTVVKKYKNGELVKEYHPDEQQGDENAVESEIKKERIVSQKNKKSKSKNK